MAIRCYDQGSKAGRKPGELEMEEETIVLYPGPGSHHLVFVVEIGELILQHHPEFTLKVLVQESHSSSRLLNSLRGSYKISFVHLTPAPAPAPSQSRSPIALTFETMRLGVPGVCRALEDISMTSRILALLTSSIHAPYDYPGIPTYYCFTSCASAMSAFMYLPTIHARTSRSFQDQGDALVDCPGLPPIKASDLPEPVLDRNDPAYHGFLEFSTYLPRSRGILLNTFQSLEPRALGAIAAGACIPNGATPPVYSIGPIVANARDRMREDLNQDDQDSCLSWLDMQPSRSVVFLCFGSRGAFAAPQLKQIAIGLEKSNCRFLWVVKNPPPDIHGEPDLDALLPRGFLERTQGKGRAVKTWAPQAAILRHKSVGGFVTHCGWNSVLEAVSCGVPMVAWPLYAEQWLNAVVMVEEMKLALHISADGTKKLVGAEELEESLRELMESVALRQRSREMKDMATAAMEHGGSSVSALSDLVASWKQKK